jgi:hypothetical protein
MSTVVYAIISAEFLGRRWKTLDFEVMKGKEQDSDILTLYIHKYHDDGDCDDSLVFLYKSKTWI